MLTGTGLQTIRGAGWIADPPDTRDTLFTTSPLAVTPPASGEIDNSIYFRPVSDQLWLPSCVANAGCDMMEAATVIERYEAKLAAGVDPATALNMAILETPDLSRLFVWWCARNEMNPNRSGDANSGTYNRLAMDVLARFGVPTESRWPYIPSKATTRPSIMAFKEAFVNQFTAFYSITATGQERINQVISALSAKHNVLFGTQVDSYFSKYTGGKVIAPPRGATLGGHAMVICGWSPSKGAFKVRNSWGTSWGENGYWWMAPEYLTWSATKSLWVPTKGAL